MPFNGEMLRLARQRRGFQQTEAARLLGIEQPLLSRFENGLTEIRDDIAVAAARAYSFPLEFFAQQDPVYGAPVSVHPMWRRKADVTARELEGVVAELNLRIMHLRRLFQSVDLVNTNDLPRLDIDEYSDPERIAGIVRAHWRLPSGPLKNLTGIVEKAGIMVARSRLGGSSISGVTFAVPGMQPLVVLNSDQPGDRARFTLAHELGHLVMHRFPTSNMEQEAHDFATALLMPAADIRPYLAGKRIDLPLMAALKPEWRVSMAALIMRAHKLDLTTRNQHEYLWKQMSMRGFRLREPPELDFEAEQPSLVPQIIDFHLTSLGYTNADLGAVLNVFEPELTDLYGIGGGDVGPNRPRISIVR
jgi:Zn-dependent peptidase ImmA (M78 family)/transcriptional regulator with XRE-family HTH domain